ncbi:GTP-binding protein engA [Mycoplasma haemocanis str. Illinois]|uniref:GTPase Der n=1 Tax=Mycoplasma haemocanis (strain Illinois) TaxID=1111676 RepID=H6N8J5_MYCHN|nr:ribosome biogenesis GTPase Der [Mycoplasma haemocanis]AEW45967.1 GTP-binding protein engA [Mycoplasma haemocanis str. Illinois]
MPPKNVVIIGKPNVGKSQLFNRLVGERHAVVFSKPGVTRDRITLECYWLHRSFLLTDTGGYTLDNYSFQKEINRQTEIALKEADLILFLTSAKDGIDSDDFQIAKTLKKNRASNVLVVVNKCDVKGADVQSHLKLGFGEGIVISAEHGINTGNLLTSIVSHLGEEEIFEESGERLKIAIIGRPNVGKSSLVNSLLKKERVLVSEVSGTTRDAIDLDFSFNGKSYTLIDTPGIKRHSQMRVDEKEKYSVLRAQKAIARANTLIFMLDISEDLSELDERVGGLIFKANIPTIIVANKWDLVERTHTNRSHLEASLRKRFSFLKWAPVIFVSAKYGDKLSLIFDKLQEIECERTKVIGDKNLNLFLYKITSLFSIPTVKGRKLKMYSVSQIKSHIPTFLILCNDPNLLHFSYSRLVENQLRKAFQYVITPITVIYKKKI